MTRPSALLLAEAQGAVSGMPNLLARLSEPDRARVLALGRPRTLERGEAVSGREITLAYWYPGNFVGGPEVFGGGTHVWSGIAARRSTVLALAGGELKRLIAQMPELGIGIIEGLVFKGKCYSALAQMLGTRSVTERLSLLLRSLCDLYGIEEEDGIFIGAAFTHEDLAHMVGATRQWVTMTLKRFQQQGVLRFKRGQLTILRPDLLEQAGGAGDDTR